MESYRCANCGRLLAHVDEVCEACEASGWRPPSPAQMWRQFASEVGGELVGHRVSAPLEKWTIELETYEVDRGTAEYGGRLTETFTRMKVRFVSRDGFRFEIYREGLLSKLGKVLGVTQEIEAGYPDFDRDFIVKGNDESKMRAFLANFRIRELIQAQPSIHLSVSPSRPVSPGSKGDVVLSFEERGMVSDIERLWSLYELFGESLNQLCEIGSASQEAANVEP